MKKIAFIVLLITLMFSAVKLNENFDQNLFDFTQVSSRWKYLCVTSFNSGDPYFIQKNPFNEMRRQTNYVTPKDWDKTNVYLFMVDFEGDFEIKLIPVNKIPQHLIYPYYAIYPYYDMTLVPPGYAQCAERQNAILQCVPTKTISQSECVLLFASHER
jgi:hypothetical protein